MASNEAITFNTSAEPLSLSINSRRPHNYWQPLHTCLQEEENDRPKLKGQTHRSHVIDICSLYLPTHFIVVGRA